MVRSVGRALLVKALGQCFVVVGVDEVETQGINHNDDGFGEVGGCRGRPAGSWGGGGGRGRGDDGPEGLVFAMAIVRDFLPGKEKTEHKDGESEGLEEPQDGQGAEGGGGRRGREGRGRGGRGRRHDGDGPPPDDELGDGARWVQRRQPSRRVSRHRWTTLSMSLCVFERKGSGEIRQCYGEWGERSVANLK